MLLSNVTLSGANITDFDAWITRLALGPYGQIEKLTMSHNSWEGLMRHVESAKKSPGSASEESRALTRAFSGLQHIELQFDILEDFLVRLGVHIADEEWFCKGLLGPSLDAVGRDMISVSVQVSLSVDLCRILD